MSVRAPKSGINRDVQIKINAKYDCELARQCLTWMQTIIGEDNSDVITDEDGNQDNLFEQLKDGFALVILMEKLQPGSFRSQMLSKKATMAFKQMEALELFINKCKDYGVADMEVFQVPDLYERQNLHQVTICIQALARKAASKGHPGFGPKESTECRRSFTEEQLRQSEAVIGLQMGTNKGASQSGGTAFGARRHISDNH